MLNRLTKKLTKSKSSNINKILFSITILLICYNNILGQTNNIKSTTIDLINKSENLTYVNLDSSEILIDSALDIATKNNLTWEMAKAKKQKGLIRYFQIRFTEALDLSIESNELFKQINDSEGQASALNLIAIVYTDQGRLNEALHIYHQILEIIDENNINRKTTTLNNIGYVYFRMKNFQECYKYYLQAFNTIKGLNKLDSESQYCNNLGIVLIKLEKKDSALLFIKKGLNLALKINNAHRIANSYENLGDFYFWQKDYKKALDFYHRAYEYVNKLNIVYEISSTARGLSQTYAALNDFENAFKYLQIEKTMSDSIKQREIASHITQIELEKSFQKERDLNEAINDKNRLLRNIYIIIIIAILLIAGILFISFAQKKKSYVQLKTYTNKILSQKQEIEYQTDELKRLSSLKDKLFSIISHDLRSPLTSLVSMLNLTKDKVITKEQYYELINEMLENVNYTTNMVDNLLLWASSQQEGIKLKKMNIELDKLIDSIKNEFNNQANQKNIQIINNVSERTGIYADKAMLEIVFRNLISNALKFSFEGSNITLSAKEINNSYVQVSVIDNGIGITEKILSKLFSNVVESRNGTKNEKGTGLGLMLCKEFIELNNGSINVTSSEGKGSAFHVNIPKEKYS